MPLLLDGQRYFVTRNCHAALKRCRELRESGYFWVDSISINQKDAAEKALQIPRMHQIYSYALNVIVWLGCLENERDPGLEHQEKEAVAMIENLAKCEYMKERFLLLATKGNNTDLRWRALIDLLEHKWFARLWTHQEVGLARKAVIATNYATLPFKTFSLAMSILMFVSGGKGFDYFDKLHQRERLDRIMISVVGRTRASTRLSLYETMWATRTFQCFDPHDCVYGILGLIEPNIASQIVVDYCESMALLFAKVSQLIIRSEQSLEVLTQANGWPQAEGIKTQGCPSWVVDWSQRISPDTIAVGQAQELHYDQYRAALELTPLVSFSADAMEMNLTGYAVDSVAIATSSLGRSGELFPDILDPQHLSAYRERFMAYPASCSIEEAWVRTILLDVGRFRSDSTPRLSSGNTEAAECLERYMAVYSMGPEGIKAEQSSFTHQSWEHRSQETRPALQETISDFEITVNEKVPSRSFFISSTGYMGLGPASLREEDIVCIFPGCRVPLVVRKREDHYILVGECFVWGLMDGEGLTSKTEDELTTFRIL